MTNEQPQPTTIDCDSYNLRPLDPDELNSIPAEIALTHHLICGNLLENLFIKRNKGTLTWTKELQELVTKVKNQRAAIERTKHWKKKAEFLMKPGVKVPKLKTSLKYLYMNLER